MPTDSSRPRTPTRTGLPHLDRRALPARQPAPAPTAPYTWSTCTAACIQHKAFLTNYLIKNIKERKLEQPIHLGRIYRIVPTEADAAAGEASRRSPKRWSSCLTHPNGWVRDTAQRLLVERTMRRPSARSEDRDPPARRRSRGARSVDAGGHDCSSNPRCWPQRHERRRRRRCASPRFASASRCSPRRAGRRASRRS